MLRPALLPALLLLSFMSHAEAQTRQESHASVDNQCKKTLRPKNAKLIHTRAFDFYLYPTTRAERMNGCQRVWFEDGTLLVTEYYRGGVLQWARITEPDAPAKVCRFEKGALNRLSSAQGCPESSFVDRTGEFPR